MSERPTTDEILAQTGWVRDLARRMVSDAHLAEDLAQETLTAALEHPPTHGLKLRPWLARVLRNFRNQVARSEGRRRLREEAIARREGQGGAGEEPGALEELVWHRELTEAVLALDEPYRTAIVLRFLRELPPREIARRQGVPVKTVDSRIARGLAKLRERFDRDRDGDSRAWMLLFASSLEPESGLAAGTLGVLALNTKLALTLISIAAVAAVAVFFRGGATEPVARELPSLATAEAADPRDLDPAPAASAPALSSSGGGRVAEPGAERPVPEAAVVAAATSFAVRGRVLGSDGGPLSGLAVGLKDAPGETVLSGPGGWFELNSSTSQARLEAFDERYVTVRAGIFNEHDAVPPVVVVAPAIELAGRVLDGSGQGLSGASLRLEQPRELEARIGWNLESSSSVDRSTRTNRDGEYAFGQLPAVDGAVLTVVLDGYDPAQVPVPSATDLHLDVVLALPSAPVNGTLAGRVVGPDGQSVPGARVALGLASVLADADGEFQIDLSRAVTAQTLRAIKPGFLPAVMERPFEPDEDAEGSEARGWPERVELRLPGEALSIAGRVLTDGGEPVAGVRLWLADPTPFGVVGMMPTSSENLSSGAEVPPEALQFAAGGPTEDGQNYWDFHMPAGPSTAFWRWVRTDDDGGFVIDGLSDRDYRLKVMDDASLTVHESEPIRAGRRGVDVRLPAPERWAVLSGRVVAEGGVAMEGVRVRLALEAYGERARIFGGRVEVALHQSREEVVTDASGRFEFRDVPRQAVYLALESNDIVPSRFELAGDEDGNGLRVEVEARCHVEVLLERTPGAAVLAAFDADGGHLDALRISGPSISANSSLEIVDGATGVFSVSARTASFLIADENGVELARLPVHLIPGEVNLVRD